MEFLKGSGGIYYLIAVIAAAMALEVLAPWRKPARLDFWRWVRNAAMNFYGVILLGLIPVISGFGGAVFAQRQDIGLLNLADAPLVAGVIISIVMLDLVAFLQHRALHKWYVLWRTHRPHHSDAVIDATTCLRFHPLESLFRAATELPVIIALGLPPEGVLWVYAVFVVVNAYTHFNVNIPLALERPLSMLVITPRAHRLHHAVSAEFHETNFGTLFSLWDRLSGTWTPPEKLRDDESFGLDGAEAMAADTFGNLALDPFRKRAEDPDGEMQPHG